MEVKKKPAKNDKTDRNIDDSRAVRCVLWNAARPHAASGRRDAADAGPPIVILKPFEDISRSDIIEIWDGRFRRVNMPRSPSFVIESGSFSTAATRLLAPWASNHSSTNYSWPLAPSKINGRLPFGA